MKLSKNMKDLLSNLLQQIKSQVPQDFQRTTRSLDDISKFKATEYQFLLLYAGPVIFKKVLSEDVYKHFLLLHVGIRLLCSKDLAIQKVRHAKYCLKLFIETSKILYGKQCLVSNMHGLDHLADDVQYMNCTIPEVSAYSFENCLGRLRRLIRTGNRPLSQLCRRLSELSFAHKEKPSVPAPIKILKQLPTDETNNTPIKTLEFKQSIITSKYPDNVVLLSNKNIVLIEKIYIQVGENLIKISGLQLKKKGSMFEYPLTSEHLNMWAVSKRNCRRVTVPLASVDKKMVPFLININNTEKMYVIPLLHM